MGEPSPLKTLKNLHDDLGKAKNSASRIERPILRSPVFSTTSQDEEEEETTSASTTTDERVSTPVYTVEEKPADNKFFYTQAQPSTGMILLLNSAKQCL